MVDDPAADVRGRRPAPDAAWRALALDPEDEEAHQLVNDRRGRLERALREAPGASGGERKARRSR